MDLKYKADWEAAQDRFEAWWDGGQAGPLIQVECPRAGADAPGRPSWRTGDDPWWWFMQWQVAEAGGRATGMDSFLDLWEEHLGATAFLGDAYPQFWLNQGPGSLAAYLTGHLAFQGNTTWFEMSEPMEWRDIMALSLEHDAPWLVRTFRAARDGASRGKDRFVTGVPDIGGIHDVLASLRTSQQLMEDFIEDPVRVAEAAQRLIPMWQACFDEVSDLIDDSGQYGTSSWMGVWAPGRSYPFQCDVSAMLSPAMFEEHVLPVLAEQCQGVDHAIYHWDGPGQIPHLDMLLSIPELAAIQWVPGAGAPQAGDEKWFPLYERIQKAGKRLILNNGVSPQDVVPLLKRFNPRGLLVSTWCHNEAEGLKLLDEARKAA